VDRLKAKKAKRVALQTKADALDRLVRAATHIRAARVSPVYAAPALLTHGERPADERPELQKPRYCYVCKAPFTKLHFFYDAMCPACGEFQTTPSASRRRI